MLREENVGDDSESVVTESAPSESYYPQHSRQRPHSFSTISEHQSTSSIRPRGEFHRVVIDRSDDSQSNKRDATEEPPTRPALEIPIPHYRLGLPQFNTAGSAAFQSSVGTRGSTPDYLCASRLAVDGSNGSPLPNVYLGDALVPERPSFVSSILSGTGAAAIELGPAPAEEAETSVFYEVNEPIEPSVFEDLVSVMDDESVVRYIPGTEDISAASPARIVAQISSESFMDYELVSDFFLTFRSYLSSSHLLALLLARLQWAINRWQDDGRIIRIRTFAALRHWILNYFVDDFLEDYGLRTYFCDAINSMYNDVKTREGGGASDLKILIDLKRCWHGKCIMCWDAPELSAAYYHPDSPIVAGGVLEVTDGREAKEQDQHGVQQADWPLPTGNPGVFGPVDVSGEEGGQQSALAQQQHYRQHSEATARSIPVSTQSDQSCFNVTSCSMRPKSPNRASVPLSPNKAPHPVPLLPAKNNRSSQDPPKSSPVTPKRHPFYSHAHKRSGSFSDSVRDDRAPLPLLKLDQWSQELLDSGSLIRGTLYAPAESYMTMMAPPSPPLPLPGSSPALERQTTADGASKQASTSSGVKTIIGSIRRVFNSSKHGVQSATSSRHTRGPSGSPMRGGKTSALPNNVAFGSDFYRNRKNSAATSKKPTRIDTLCDQVLKEYRQAIADRKEAKDEPSPQLPQSAAAGPPQGEEDLPTPRLQVPSQRPASGKSRAGSGSGLTMGSESIVIVDDTGLDIPMVSGANGEPIVNFERTPTFVNAEGPPATPKTMSLRVPSYYNNSSSSTRADDEYSLQIFYDDSGAVPSQRASKTETFYKSESSSATSHMSGSVERDASSFRKKTSPSLRLRKYASFQSGISRISKHLPAMGSEVPLVVDPNVLQDEPEKHGGPVLRRRPGGDLRKMQHGRSPLSYLGSRSSASIVDSEASAPREAISRPQNSLISSNPRHSFLQTNSSQDVRRSFEATIAKFSQIPDDDDGGVESTLLKLEGKWSDDNNIRDGAAAPVPEHGDGRHRRNVPILQLQQRNGAEDAYRRRQTVIGDSHARGRLLPLRPYSDSVADSEESFSSIPLLERGLSNESTKKPVAAHGPSPTATPRPRLSSRNEVSNRESSHQSLDVVKETESMRRIPRGSRLPIPRPKTSRGRLSQLSSELSADAIDRQEVADGRPSMDTTSLGRSSFGIPPHPLAQPPSPPMTIQHPRSVTSCATPLDPILVQARPLTPDTSPNRRNTPIPGRDRSATMQQQDVLSRSELDQKQQQQQQQNNPNSLPDVDHVPFVLSCESALLAQQLTLVEMAALSEIDWRDLVEMRWSRSSPSTTLSWVQFLTAENQDHRGIDLVVGRFNLMVKWVLSEIVLTPDIHERVQTISKFIHTAAHAKRLCNYATMLQIAIALSSTDCSRLEKTWMLVPPEDKRLLKDMEALIQPVRNFHDLRVEMETANLQEGCIPFVGRFTQHVPPDRQARY